MPRERSTVAPEGELDYISTSISTTMYRNLIKSAGILTVSAGLLWGCSGPGEVHDYTVEDLEVNLVGPLFEGPNQGQLALEIDLAAALGEDYEEGMKITDAHLSSATVSGGDSLGFEMVRSFVLSFASDNADVAMQEAAFKNPLPEGASEVALEVSADSELGELMAEGKVYVVLDADLMEDYWDGDRTFLLDLSLALTVK